MLDIHLYHNLDIQNVLQQKGKLQKVSYFDFDFSAVQYSAVQYRAVEYMAVQQYRFARQIEA